MSPKEVLGWVLAFVVGCGSAASSWALPSFDPKHHAEPFGERPPGEVWLTPDQLRDGNVTVQAVAEQPLDEVLVTSGRVALDDPHVGHVFSPVNGRVVRIGADVGARVKKGEVLAVIESPDVGAAASDVSKARADVIAARHDLTRRRDLAAANAASQAVVEQSEDNWRRATAELERAERKAALLRARTFDAVTQTFALTSPVDGEVLERSINPGVEVQGQYSGGSPELFTVGELGRVWVLADLYESDIGRVREGSPASLTVVAYGDRVFRGTVDWVSAVLDPATRTARVRCTLENPGGLLRPEMYATVRFPVASRRALAVPRETVLRLGEYRVVFRRLGAAARGRTRFERIPVEVDEEATGPLVEVRHGLEAGEEVVVTGGAFLSQML